MMDRSKLVANSMQLARQMIGINEQQMLRESALTVFYEHGGKFDSDHAPITGPCQKCGSFVTCDFQRLAFSMILMESVLQTAVEYVTEQVMQRIARGQE